MWTGNDISSHNFRHYSPPPIFPVCSLSFPFLLKECSDQKTYMVKVDSRASRHLSRPPLLFWGPLVTILDFAKGAALKAVRHSKWWVSAPVPRGWYLLVSCPFFCPKMSLLFFSRGALLNKQHLSKQSSGHILLPNYQQQNFTLNTTFNSNSIEVRHYHLAQPHPIRPLPQIFKQLLH